MTARYPADIFEARRTLMERGVEPLMLVDRERDRTVQISRRGRLRRGASQGDIEFRKAVDRALDSAREIIKVRERDQLSKKNLWTIEPSGLHFRR